MNPIAPAVAPRPTTESVKMSESKPTPPVAPRKPHPPPAAPAAKPKPPPPTVAAKPSPKLAPKAAPKPAAAKPSPKLAPKPKPKANAGSQSPRNARTNTLTSIKKKPSAIRMEAGASQADMEEARRRNIAYEYLCHIEETRTWMQACLKEHALKKREEELDAMGAPPAISPEQRMMANLGIAQLTAETETDADDDLPPPPPELEEDEMEQEEQDEFELPSAAELEERLRNGVMLVKLAQFFTEGLSDRRIYDASEAVYHERGLVFRHTDNILQWIKAMEKKGLPKVFFPEVTDIYDKKNMPKAIYCLHALSRFLYSKGIGPKMQDMQGVAQFTEEEINAMDSALAEAGVQMPQFGKIGGVLAAEVGEDAAAVHAAILGINQAIEAEVTAADLHEQLLSLAAGLDHVNASDQHTERYRTDLIVARKSKIAAHESNANPDESETDIYDNNLTKEEIQNSIDEANAAVAEEIRVAQLNACLESIGAAVAAGDADALAASMSNGILGLTAYNSANVVEYLAMLAKVIEDGKEVNVEVLQNIVNEANQTAELARQKASALQTANGAVAAADEAALVPALMEPLLGLLDVIETNAPEYIQVLNEMYTASGDLSHEQFQEGITKANLLASVDHAVDQVKSAIDEANPDVLVTALQMQALKLDDVRPTASMEYLVSLQQIHVGDEGLSAESIAKSVAEANHLIDEEARAEAAVAKLNDLVFEDDADAVLAHLRENAELLELPPLVNNATRYHEAFTESAKSLGKLSQTNVRKVIVDVNQTLAEEETFAGAVAAINEAAAGDDASATFAALGHQSLALEGVRANVESTYYSENGADRYHASIKAAIAEGPIDAPGIQKCISDTNTAIDSEQAFAEALGVVNTALSGDDVEGTLAALKSDVLALTAIDDAGAEQYHANMKELTASTEEGGLTIEQLQGQVDHTNFVAEENAKHAGVIFSINDIASSVPSPEVHAALYAGLADKYSRIDGAQEKCAEYYFVGLSAELQRKAGSDPVGGGFVWKMSKDAEERPYYYNKESKETLWLPPDEVADKFLTKNELQDLVNTWNHYESSEGQVVAVQAQIRGALQKKKFRDRKAFIEGQTNSIVMVQSLVRMVQQKRRFRKRLNFLNSQEEAAVRIQAGWKGTKARRNYKGLTKVVNPPVNTVRRFLHLLDQSEIDFSEELEVGKLKEKVVTAIKQNVQLEADVHDMDVKIELLVKNRIELQSVVNQAKSMKQRHNKKNATTKVQSWWKTNSAESRARRESYQHLFYLLQTNPEYLASLVFIDKPMKDWSNVKSQKFLDKIIQTTYNFGSNAREKYLLCKLFQVAQRKEIFEKVSETKEFISGQPTVVRLAINHFRKQGSDEYFMNTLRKPVMEILQAKDLDLTTDPCEVYKQWVNRTERETGEASGLPYEVEREQALSRPEVRKIIGETVTLLLKHVSKFLDAVIKSLSHLPFGLRHLCMCLKEDLLERFSDATEEQVGKIVSNLLYYRFLNPVITAPEGIVIMPEENIDVSQVQRRNLSIVARVLQFAADKKTFDQTQDNAELNAFLKNASQKFAKYFEDAVNVESAEIHFNIDEYSDVTMLSKPTIFITQAEIHHTHEMLLANMKVVAADQDDPLNVIMEELGEPAWEGDIITNADGSTEHASIDWDHPEFTNEVSLTLQNRFELPEEEDHSIKALFVRTKRLVIDVIRFQQGKNLKEILDKPVTEAENKAHTEFILERAAKDAEQEKEVKSKRTSFKRRISTHDGLNTSTLAETKTQIYTNIKQLEPVGLCTIDDNYQGLLNSVAQDIRNQRIYRRQRKQELGKLRTTLDELAVKKEYMDDQIKYFDSYIESAKEQITKGKKSGGKSKISFKKKQETDEEGRHFGSYKYSAQRLKEKGVLINIEDISDGKLKHVYIEISRETVNTFAFNCKFLGVQMDKEVVDFEDLLELQYNNVGVTKMFTYCTINVNLLIYLLNKKFYSK